MWEINKLFVNKKVSVLSTDLGFPYSAIIISIFSLKINTVFLELESKNVYFTLRDLNAYQLCKNEDAKEMANSAGETPFYRILPVLTG